MANELTIMVNGPDERKDAPHYSLERVRELAAAGHIHHGSWRVTTDIENLGYTPEGVCQCLATLEASYFRHSEHYPDPPNWLDVYHRSYVPGADQASDGLYIKFKLTRPCTAIVLCSFHLDR